MSESDLQAEITYLRQYIQALHAALEKALPGAQLPRMAPKKG